MDFRYNGREVTHRYSNVQYANVAASALFYGSLALYFQKYFRVNKSIPKFAAFTVASYLAANEWSKFLLLPTVQEAVIINNQHEKSKIEL